MVYSIDRFEEDYAVLEHDGECFAFLRSSLPENAAEGDLLEWSDEHWHVLHQETDSRRKWLAERRRRMLEGKK